MSGQTTTDNLPQIDLDALDQQTMIAVTVLQDRCRRAEAGQQWLAETLASHTLTHCPVDLGYMARCHRRGATRCEDAAVRGKLTACWLRAAAQATQGGE